MMTALDTLFEQDTFLKTVFEAIPCGVMIVDSDRRIRTVNNVVEQTFGIEKARVTNLRGGEALGCIHAGETAEGCGYSDFCEGCEIKNTALKAIAGRKTYRAKAQLQIDVSGTVNERTILVSSAPMDNGDERLAIILLEDITELSILRQRLRTEQSFRGIVGRDPRMLELFDSIRELADVDVPVLVQGETGTGKELVAAAIHNESPRAQQLFVPVNCGALPETLIESELFGHVKGAFTGAIRDKKGRFELAHKGTIFLDEIGDISQAMQVKILRVLEQGTFERVGSEKTLRVDIRVISATNKNLMREIAKNTFRKDLYYRLSVVPIDLPPLRERKSDIPLLCDFFMEKIGREAEREPVRLAPETLDVLMTYEWPGNVRELQNWIQYAMVKCKGRTIEPLHLPPEYAAAVGQVRSRRRKLDVESVRQTLAETNGNKVHTARQLGVARATLYRFLADHDIV